MLILPEARVNEVIGATAPEEFTYTGLLEAPTSLETERTFSQTPGLSP